jgi:hypothetical protein
MVYLLGKKPAGDSDPRTEGGVCQIGGWVYSGARYLRALGDLFRLLRPMDTPRARRPDGPFYCRRRIRPTLHVTDWNPIVIPEHALLIVEERLREQQAEGVRMPEGMRSPNWGIDAPPVESHDSSEPAVLETSWLEAVGGREELCALKTMREQSGL